MEEIAGCILLAFCATFVVIKMAHTSTNRKRKIDDGDDIEASPRKKISQKRLCPCFPQNPDDQLQIDKPKGIPNVGSTCFMSSIIQCLCWCPSLELQLEKEVQRNGETETGKRGIAKCLMRLMEEMHGKRGSKIQRRTVDNLLNSVRRRNPQFNGYDQQDSFELYNTIISGIEEEGCTQEENKKNFVSSLFSGKFMTVYFYEECEHVDVVFQDFTSLSVPFTTDVKGKTGKHKGKGTNIVHPVNHPEKSADPVASTSSISIEVDQDKPFKFDVVDELNTQNDDLSMQSSQKCILACLTPLELKKETSVERGLRMLTKEETFSTDTLTCRDCEKDADRAFRKTGTDGKCYKRLLLAELPPVLVLQISRFRQVGKNLIKIKDPFTYTCELDVQSFCALSDIVKQEHLTKYSLFGVVSHSGNLQSGHYYAYVKTPRRNVSDMNNEINNPDHEDLESRRLDIIQSLRKHLSDANKNVNADDNVNTDDDANADDDVNADDEVNAPKEEGGRKSVSNPDWDATSPSKTTSVPRDETMSGTKWFYTSDSSVTEVPEHRVLNDTNACMLMYVRT